MPIIRYTYGPDVQKHGDAPIVVEDVEARVLTEMRRAVLVDAEELEKLSKPALAEVAEQVGAEVRPRDPKGHYVKAIVDAEAE